MVRFEESAGGVVIRRGERGVEFLLVLPAGSRKWRFPKGLLEPGESPRQTALREVQEEAGVEARILAPLQDIGYMYRLKGEVIRKTVHFFLMEYVSGDPSRHDFEVTDATFLPAAQARSRLAFEDERRLLDQAIGLLGSDPSLPDTSGRWR